MIEPTRVCSGEYAFRVPKRSSAEAIVLRMAQMVWVRVLEFSYTYHIPFTFYFLHCFGLKMSTLRCISAHTAPPHATSHILFRCLRFSCSFLPDVQCVLPADDPVDHIRLHLFASTSDEILGSAVLAVIVVAHESAASTSLSSIFVHNYMHIIWNRGTVAHLPSE